MKNYLEKEFYNRHKTTLCLEQKYLDMLNNTTCLQLLKVLASFTLALKGTAVNKREDTYQRLIISLIFDKFSDDFEDKSLREQRQFKKRFLAILSDVPPRRVFNEKNK